MIYLGVFFAGLVGWRGTLQQRQSVLSRSSHMDLFWRNPEISHDDVHNLAQHNDTVATQLRISVPL
jgi:hypothetical protein